MPGTSNVKVSNIAFDDSQYRGQCLETSSGLLPHGYGRMETEQGFEMRGYFCNGKARGPGRFKAPNGDTFYGTWNENHKREGEFLFIRGKDKLHLVEKYSESGEIKGKRAKARPSKKTTIHWTLESLNHPRPITGDIPAARYGHTTSALKDMLILFGGQQVVDGRPEPLNDIYILDYDSMEWVTGEMEGDVPPPMYGHTATVVGDEIVVIGGHLEGMGVSSSVYVFNTITGVWSEVISKGMSFTNHTASLIGDNKIIVIVQASVYTLNLADWTWTEEQVDCKGLSRHSPRSIICHSACVVGDMIVVVGGRVLGAGSQPGNGPRYEKCSNEVRILHTKHMAWEIPEIDPPEGKRKQAEYSGVTPGAYDTTRAEHTATLFDDRYIYIFGGWHSSNPALNVIDTTYLDDVQVLDLQEMKWISPAIKYNISTCRSQHSAALVKDEIWMFGGLNHAEYALSFAEMNVLHCGEDRRQVLRRARAAREAKENKRTQPSDPI